MMDDPPAPPERPPPPPPLRVALGSVLGRSVLLWARSLPTFTAISLVVFAPLLVWAYRFTSEERTAEEVESFSLWSWGAANLLATLLGAGVVHGVLARLRGRPAGPWACLTNALARFFPVLGVTLLTLINAWLVYMLAMLPWTLVSRSARFRDAENGGSLVGYGFVAIASLLMCSVSATYYVGVPVAVLERPGVRKSMARSASLTRGNRLRLLGLVLLWMATWFGATRTADALFPDSMRATTLCWLGLTALVLAPLGAICSALVYHDLRRGLEGATLEDLTSVFD